MSYKMYNILWSILPMFATTYGSGNYNASTYNGVVGGAAPAVVTIGPITLPVTGATMAVFGTVLVAAAAAIIVWIIQSRRAKA